jgi:hypothetical protein
MYGKARMSMKAGLTFACMNLKKLAKLLRKKGKPNGTTPESTTSFTYFLYSLVKSFFGLFLCYKKAAFA